MTSMGKIVVFNGVSQMQLEMWANAQLDGRPAEYRVAPSVQRRSLADAHY